MEEGKISAQGWTLAFRGALLVLMGVLIFRYPVEALVSFVVYLGILLVVEGLLSIIFSFRMNTESFPRGLLLLFGVLDLIFGTLFLTHPIATVGVIPFVLGFFLIFDAIIQFFYAFSLLWMRINFGSLGILSGIITLILAWIILAIPKASVIYIGSAMIVMGVFYLISSFGVNMLRHAFSD
ncbi:HdeD family acid-resistance protein [Xanthovirga aplysinae]|uniref:HdeD family acid-resistance protein n=1 Tax=Xanthovirga aplysinae TaxID=2529853 RepID=UPI0012BBB554|nr:DUF308 domain-containing protein [Xanthovirga aplysinae]MTI30240.1 hypothetical protein [Xanthovirga aplysinae]